MQPVGLGCQEAATAERCCAGLLGTLELVVFAREGVDRSLAGGESRSRLPNSTVRLLSKKPRPLAEMNRRPFIHKSHDRTVTQRSEQDRSGNHAHIAYGAKYPW